MEATCETCRCAWCRPIRNEMMSGEAVLSEDLPSCVNSDSPLYGRYLSADQTCGEHQPRDTENSGE